MIRRIVPVTARAGTRSVTVLVTDRCPTAEAEPKTGDRSVVADGRTQLVHRPRPVGVGHRAVDDVSGTRNHHRRRNAQGLPIESNAPRGAHCQHQRDQHRQKNIRFHGSKFSKLPQPRYPSLPQDHTVLGFSIYNDSISRPCLSRSFPRGRDSPFP